MNKLQHFKNFLESFKGDGNDALIETLQNGFYVMFEGRFNKEPRHSFNPGDKVKISEDGLIRHSRSTPAHAGYSQDTINWRNSLLKLKQENAVGTIERTFPNSNHVNVDFNGHLLGVDSYMLTPVI